MDLIGDIIPMVNGACTNTTQATLVRKLTFYVTTAREFFLFNNHGTHGNVDKTSKEYIKYDPNGYTCCDNNDYLDLRSPVPFELDINWDDGSDVEHVVATKSGSYYYVRWYSYDSDYYKKYTGNGTDGQKDQMIPSWAFKNHIFEGSKKEHVVTMTFTEGYIDYIYAYYLSFGKYPLFEVPELKTISTNECPCDVVNTDRFLYCPNLEKLGLRSLITNKYAKYPDSLWQLTKLKYLYIDSFVSDEDADSNGIRNISKLKNLVELTLHNGVDRYIREFNDIPNLRLLKISQSNQAVSNVHTMFSNDSITKINPKLSNFNPLSCWQDDTVTDMDIVTGACLNEIEDLSGLTKLPSFYCVPKGKKLVIPDWMDRIFNVRTFEFNKMFGQDTKGNPATMDLGIEALYDHAKQFGYNASYVDGDYKGKRNPWYGTTLSVYSQNQPVNQRPTGTYQAPSGFEKGVSDGSPSTPMEMIYVLVNNYRWTCIIPPETSVNTNPGETIKPQYLDSTNTIAVFSLEDTEDAAAKAANCEHLEYVGQSSNLDENKKSEGIMLLIRDDSVVNVIEGDLLNTSVYLPDGVDVVSFNTEDEAKAYCEEEGITYVTES